MWSTVHAAVVLTCAVTCSASSPEFFLSPVVWRPIIAYQGLNLTQANQKYFLGQFSLFSFGASNNQIVDNKKNTLNLLFKLSYLNSNFALNPVLNNSPLLDKQLQNFICIFNANVPLKNVVHAVVCSTYSFSVCACSLILIP